MQKFIAKFLTILVLLSSTVFGIASASFSLTQPVYADEDDIVTDLTNTPPLTNYTPLDEETPDPAVENPDESTLADDEAGNEDDAPDDPNAPDAPDDTDDADDTDGTDQAEATQNMVNTCEDQTGALAWIVCPATNLIATVTDSLYKAINDFLVVNPVTMDDHSPIYLVWQYARSITNIVFVIFLVIVIYSQLTGLGISNYGIKRILPRLIITIILVNLSFIICALAVDISNLIGAGLRDFFHSIQGTIMANGVPAIDLDLSFFDVLSYVLGGGTVAGIVIGAAAGGLGGLFWMLVTALIGALVAVASGLITIAARQALVALLIMISPLAFVAYLLPNTEKWFTQWKDLLFRMLVFYPMFSFLYGASQLAGWAIIASATSGFGIILGIAVQVVPLFLSWSLMKMSGTILGTLNTGLRSAFAPAQRGLTGWATSHGEQARQNYFANNTMPGAHLRSYLDRHRTERDIDTKNSLGIRQNRATEAALKRISSSTGVDSEGNDTWRKRAHRYTRTAKRASLYATRAENAQAAYKNTLSAYGNHFKSIDAKKLADAHADAYLDSMKQQFLTTNEAQADQEYLLNQYIKAVNGAATGSTQYNQLIRGAAGSLGHTGESSIMGQVIIGNAAIEERRRKEGRVMINKFGMEKHKGQFRAMNFDFDFMGDNGFAQNDRGEDLEDRQYNFIGGAEAREKHRYQFYIGVNKETGEEITKAEYDSLSASEREQFRKVKYFDLTDDDGNVVQRIFDDDAGYMKELLLDDIAIADPINRRYAVEIGVAQNDAERNGVLRKYHSTIRTALDHSDFKTHAAGMTPMLTSAANAGYIRNMSDYYYILAQSLAVASKPGAFHKNDKFFVEEAHDLVKAAMDPAVFDQLFKPEEILGIVNNNGVPIDGMRLATDENGNQYWEQINYQDLAKMDPQTAAEYKKNFIIHGQLPKTLTSLVGFFGRPMSQDAQASLKPGALPAMKKMLDTLKQLGLDNLNPDIPFEARPDGNKNIFSTPDGRILYRDVVATSEQIQKLYNLDSNGNPSMPGSGSTGPIGPNGGGGGTPRGGGSPAPMSGSSSLGTLQARLARAAEARQRYDERNNTENIMIEVEDMFERARTYQDLNTLISDLITLFSETETLRPLFDECKAIIERVTSMPLPDRDNFIQQITNPYEAYEEDQIDVLYTEIISLIYRNRQD